MISRTGVHAVTALVFLARLGPGQYAGAGEVAQRVGAPRNYLGKLLKMLADQGLLESQKGKGGGFRLARSAGSVSLYDVMDPLEKVSRWNGCFLGQGRCADDAPCTVHQRWKGVRDTYLQFLKETTLADMIHREDLPAETAGGAGSTPPWDARLTGGAAAHAGATTGEASDGMPRMGALKLASATDASDGP